MENTTELAKVYAPELVEKELYQKWLDNGYFRAKVNPDKKPYTIVMPPPNITGQLHMGHALDNTLQDILIRWKRMSGFEALWMPGTDHASIATEAKIVAAIEAEGLTKDAIGREAFLERAWEWRRIYGGKIVEQLKRLGCSCDWEQERFTMDEGLSEAVTDVFIKLYDEGLIYKGERIINWCPKCGTSISDAEVEYQEKDGHFWYVRYPVLGEEDTYITVATTRPETILGDTAVAVNPNDERYASLIGKTVMLPLMNREIPIIADDYVDPEFGTGAVKITPAHDPNDFEVGLRHQLPQIKIMDDEAVLNANAGVYQGMERYKGRKKVVADLEQLGLLVKTEPHKHNVGECYRCRSTIEPMISLQWFVKMTPLAKPAIEVVREGKTSFVPDRFSKIYYNWMENIQDWCISRQLWWGHRIPAYYCDSCGEIIVQKNAPAACPKCGSHSLKQDNDTLDTWFSSALWPFSTLDWPKDTEKLRYFYPTDVLVTGYDIIFFWVARMIFSGVAHMKQTPFHHVFIHGIVRDANGLKMSKSLGNGIDPLEVIDEFGTDALRFALVIGNSPGNDLRFSKEKVESARNFANKIWNASRFILLNIGEDLSLLKEQPQPQNYTVADKWILSDLNNLVREVTENLERFELGIALQKIYEFIWDEFCDWYIELVKPRLFDKNAPARVEALHVLSKVMTTSMQLLHPFMPFITEAIYMAICDFTAEMQSASKVTQNDAQTKSIMISEWPKFEDALAADAETKKMQFIMEVIRNVRNIRSEMDVPPSKKVNAVFVTNESDKIEVLKEGSAFIERLAGIGSFEVQETKENISEDVVSFVVEGVETFIPLGELVDFEKEKVRLEKELSTLEKEISRAKGKLENEGFIAKAPQKIVDEEREKQKKHEDMYQKIKEMLTKLEKKLS